MTMAADPYKYFRIEARELLDGLSQNVLALEGAGGAAQPGARAQLLRLAHTLKGAARVVKQSEIAEGAHRLEGIVAGHRDDGQPLPPASTTELLHILDEIAIRVRVLEGAPAADVGKKAAPVVEEPIETLRIEVDEMEKLLRSVTEASVQFSAVRRQLEALDHMRNVTTVLRDQLAVRRASSSETAAPHSPEAGHRARSLVEELGADLDRFRRSLAANVERVDGEFAQLRDAAYRLRLVPARSVFPSLERAARDAAETLGKRAVFEASGGDVRLDASVLGALRGALLQLVKNAIAHGIESEDDRARAGKPPKGRVELAILRRGNRAVFVCRDDGRGVDEDAVRRAARVAGLISKDHVGRLSPEELTRLLLTSGLTTRAEVNEISGRGVGLDVVREAAARVKGEISIRSEPGKGTTIEIDVPISVASLAALLVASGDTLAAVPLDAVRQTLRIQSGDISTTADSSTILYRGQVLPFILLAGALGQPASPDKGRAWSAVIVSARNRVAAVGVDRLAGTSNIVVRAVPDSIDPDPVIAGISLDEGGNPQLVLDPAGLVAAAENRKIEATTEAEAARAPILVVDDSLTTRMLERSILQSAGYDVDLAISGEDALSKSRERRYGLFIVDVDMPGMDGFEFVASTRADRDLRDVPAILVTSRNAPSDRRRGEEVGACDYIVKSEFDQGRLLQTIRTLIG